MKNIEEFESEKHKLKIFESSESVKKYVQTIEDFLVIFNYLTDSEKIEVMRKQYFKQQNNILKTKAVYSINDDEIKIKMLQDESITNGVVDRVLFEDIVNSMKDDKKIEVLNNTSLLKHFEIMSSGKAKIIQSMSQEKIKDIILKTDLIKGLEINKLDIANIIIKIKDDSSKQKIMNMYKFEQFEKNYIIKSFSFENKKEIIEKNELGLKKLDIMDIIHSFSIEEKIQYFESNKRILESNGIAIFDIVRNMNSIKQIEFMDNINRINLSEQEKRKIIAGLKNETKEKIDTSKIEGKYIDLIKLKLYDGNDNFSAIEKIIPDLDIPDLNLYKDLDDLLYLNPLNNVKNNIDVQKCIELCKICPKIEIRDNLGLVSSTATEFIKSEKWINSILNNLSNDWTDVQKMAYIDVAIGKKISYAPEHGTDVEKPEDERALWKIISTGYGVCNGIAQVEKYILNRVGIESEIVSTKNHAYLIVKNIEIPTDSGNKKGCTLIDPTWNLASSRFGATPQHFCKSYEELRKVDVANGKDYECHKNDELENVDTIEMDELNLKKVYKSINIADKNGDFPIKQVISKCTQIDNISENAKDNIKRKFDLLQQYCPEFATCINSTIKIMQGVLFEHTEKLNFKKAISSRVYDKNDPEKQAVLFSYFDFKDEGKIFYYADKEQGKFIELSQKDFEKRFDCYEIDKQLAGNKQLWEKDTNIEEKKQNSSGKIMEGEER